MEKFSGIVFDKDGTLFDFAATWASWAKSFVEDLANGDTGLAEKLSSAIGFDLKARDFSADSPVIAGTPEDIAEHLLPHLPGANPSSLINHMNLAAASAPQAEAVPLQPLLTELKAMGLKLGVATNDAELPARSHLNSAGVLEYFDFVSGSDSGFGGKPHPGSCFAFASQIRTPPGRCIMVGDSRHDLIAGRAAGMTTIAVLTGLADREVLEPLADAVLMDVGDLPAWIRRQSADQTTAA